MDIALVIVTWAIVAVAGAVALFVLTLITRHASMVARKRRRVNAERHFRPLVDGILSGAPDPDEAEMRLAPGGEPWLVVEQMLRRAVESDSPEHAVRAQRFLAHAGFTNHYRHQLLHGKRFDRAVAAGRLADYRCDTAVSELVVASADPDLGVRTAAVRALGRLGGNRALPSLVELLEEVATGRDALSRRIVTGSLTRFGAEAAPMLLPLLTHSSWRVRGAATYVLGRIGAPDVLPALIDRLTDGDSDVRAKAAVALGDLRVRSALFPLLARLEDGVWLVRMQAVRALSRLNDPMAVSAVTRRLGDVHWRVRQEAARALSGMGTPALKSLTQTLIVSDDRYAREQVVEELQRTSVLKDAIHRLANRPAARDRTRPEVALLAAVGSTGAVSVLLGAVLGHADPRVRMALVRLIADLDHPRIDPALSRVARADIDPLVREEAAVQLKRRAPNAEVA